MRRETEDDLLATDVGASMSEGEKRLKVAVLGCGSVGSQVVRLLDEQAGDLDGAGRAPRSSWSGSPYAASTRRARSTCPRAC